MRPSSSARGLGSVLLPLLGLRADRPTATYPNTFPNSPASVTGRRQA